MVRNVGFYYFSPTGGTRETGELFCRAAAESVKKIDLMKKGQPENADTDLVVFAVPVFGGRVPAPAVQRLKQLNGAGKKAVTLVVYGNRAYEDALLELNQAVAGQGFKILASAALIARHSIVLEVAEGRPDKKDAEEICVFAEKVCVKLEQGGGEEITVPGNEPYKAEMQVPAVPVTGRGCTVCGKCEEVCPVGAVTRKDGEFVSEPGKCILCMGCIAVCPSHARMLPSPLQEKMNQMLSALKDVRVENEFYI